MLSSDVVIFGTLPEDLLQNTFHEDLFCTFHGVSTNENSIDVKSHSTEEKSVALASNTWLCFTHTGQGKQWSVQLKPFQQYLDNVEAVSVATSLHLPLRPLSNTITEPLKCALQFVEDSWVCTELSNPKASTVGTIKGVENDQHPNGMPPAFLDSTSLPQDITSLSMTMNVRTSDTATFAGGDRGILPQTSLDGLLASSEHRMFVLAIAHYLGPSPRSLKEILSYIFSFRSASPDAPKTFNKNDGDEIPIRFFGLSTSNGRLAYHMKDVQAVVNLLASKGTSGTQFELKTEGYALIDLNQYDSRLTKQRVANRAFPKLSANSQSVKQYASQLHAMELYVDRDLFTRGRGIMSGLGTAKTENRVRPRNIDTNSGEDEIKMREANKYTREEIHSEGKILAQYTDLSQCGIEWESGDLGLLFITSDSQHHESMDLLKNRQAVRLALIQKSLRECQLPSMMITSDEQLVESLRDYRRLYEFYQTLMKGMESHSHVSHRARAWYDRIGPERRSASLMQQLKEWWERQKKLREKWLPVYVSLQQETYFLEKDIMKYLDLCSLGVI
ncbi:unnamed protein product [Phytomonas sp. Hart1]|nr:unnamed protein product [Phytomonas sp. Hart1]|eukprot:CCW66622.1 unnamed protein product [Phytomonas sp. isolate Hart1]